LALYKILFILEWQYVPNGEKGVVTDGGCRSRLTCWTPCSAVGARRPLMMKNRPHVLGRSSVLRLAV